MTLYEGMGRSNQQPRRVRKDNRGSHRSCRTLEWRDPESFYLYRQIWKKHKESNFCVKLNHWKLITGFWTWKFTGIFSEIFITNSKPTIDTVDGRNPAPPGMLKNPVNNGIFTISTGAGFFPSTVYSFINPSWFFVLIPSRKPMKFNINHLQQPHLRHAALTTRRSSAFSQFSPRFTELGQIGGLDQILGETKHWEEEKHSWNSYWGGFPVPKRTPSLRAVSFNS